MSMECEMVIRITSIEQLMIVAKDDDSKKLREVGDYIQNDSRVYNALFPIRDGLMVCIKK